MLISPLTARRRALWLGLGALLLVMSAYRWGVAPLAWITPVPFLIAQRGSTTWRHQLTLLAVVSAASILQVAKIITAPLPLALAIPFALPSAISAWLLLVGTEAIRRRLGELSAVAAFVALTGVSEWLSCSFSPLGMWGTGASTQVDQLLILQVAAVAGVPGIGVIMALVAATLAMLLAAPPSVSARRVALAAAALVVGVLGWAAIRLDTVQAGPSLRVAGVVIDDGPETADVAQLRQRNLELALTRTRTAAQRGAQLVVWNEAAVFASVAEEPVVLERVSTLARELSVEVVAGYAVVLAGTPRRFDNKYVWVGRDGATIEAYRKHHPVPGEPSLRGTDPRSAHDHTWGATQVRAAGAICYDFDFSETALAYGRLRAGLVALPSSDWRGIDPYHTQMARIGAISGGFSLVRPVRAATSAAFDAYGRARATMSGFEDNERILLATVPTEHVPTVYAQLGDLPVLALCGLTLAALLAGLIRRRRQRPSAP
ncbi:MAG: hypothetical protein IPI49_05880 [Myxococcales bacterium]|nr:hypothetical protein [Myxococcales bacterium]